jgi:hypothetical protein
MPMAKPKLPSDITNPGEKVTYCRNKAVELLNAASAAQDRQNKLALLDLSEQWMMLALFYEKKTKGA